MKPENLKKLENVHKNLKIGFVVLIIMLVLDTIKVPFTDQLSNYNFYFVATMIAITIVYFVIKDIIKSEQDK